MSTPPDRLYVLGSGLAVPGTEATLEYGDAEGVRFDRIPGALPINDLSPLEKVRVTQVDGLHDEPDGRDTRAPNADRHGERGGVMLYGGRTVGLTGRVEAGNVFAMRDLWSRLRATFGTAERDLLVHPPKEVPALVNLVDDNDVQDTTRWGYAPATLTPESGYASLTFTGVFQRLSYTGVGMPWGGEDVWLHVMVKAHSASAAVNSIILGFDQTLITGAVSSNSTADAIVVSPVTGDWYRIATRVPASAINPITTTIKPSIFIDTSSGFFEFHVCKVGMVALDPALPSPGAYFDGNTGGFEWAGVPQRSTSSGPHYAVNAIYDPLFTKVTSVSSQILSYWGYGTLAGYTVTGPYASKAFLGLRSGASALLDFTKDSGATARDFEANAHSVSVEPGRTYRWSCNLQQQPLLPTGTLKLRMKWRTPDGFTITATDGPSIVNAVGEASMTAAVPVGATECTPTIVALGVTTSDLNYKLYVADPCFVDVTDHDPGDFCGTGLPELEAPPWVAGPVNTVAPARRRIPRPLHLARVRKTSDAKSPEQQRNLRYTRDFTMSLRAADPRIYVLGQRARSLQMTGTPQLIVRQMPVDFSLNAGSLPAPTGWTYEGNFVTHPGTGTPYNWSQDAYNWPLLGGSPTSVLNNGVTIKSWDASGAHGTNRPAQDLVARAYRSSEGYTYASPRVVMGCSPQSTGQGFLTGSPSRMAYYSDIANVASYANKATILIKRVNSTTWLELRWSSMSVAASGGGPNPLYAFELWCSHNSSGTLATTRLAQWDYASYNSASQVLPFNPLVDQMYLVSYMLANVVYWELWRGYPSLSDTTNRVESGSYAVPSGLQSVVGTGVTGSVGMSLAIPKTASQSAFNGLSNTPPSVNYFESSKADVPAQSVACPVIGAIDTPQLVQLRGDLVDPVLSITVPEFDDLPAATSVAKFVGTTSEATPVTVDLRDGSVLDSTGANQYGTLLHGSSFETFRPGLNVVSLQAKSWNTAALAHAIATWNDALL